MKLLIGLLLALSSTKNVVAKPNQIVDSYKVTSDIDKIEILKCIDKCNLNSFVEWKAHNILYRLGIEPDRTGSVDLDNETPARRIGYYLICGVYYL